MKIVNPIAETAINFAIVKTETNTLFNAGNQTIIVEGNRRLNFWLYGRLKKGSSTIQCKTSDLLT